MRGEERGEGRGQRAEGRGERGAEMRGEWVEGKGYLVVLQGLNKISVELGRDEYLRDGELESLVEVAEVGGVDWEGGDEDVVLVA